jgi:transcriptional regulator with XRE-family HTH domain
MTDSTGQGFGARLKQARLSCGISQRELGELIGRSQSTIDNWEHENSEPSLAHLQIIARITGCSAAWLAFGGKQAKVA